jgi:hypothetical protein
MAEHPGNLSKFLERDRSPVTHRKFSIIIRSPAGGVCTANRNVFPSPERIRELSSDANWDFARPPWSRSGPRTGSPSHGIFKALCRRRHARRLGDPSSQRSLSQRPRLPARTACGSATAAADCHADRREKNTAPETLEGLRGRDCFGNYLSELLCSPRSETDLGA